MNQRSRAWEAYSIYVVALYIHMVVVLLATVYIYIVLLLLLYLGTKIPKALLESLWHRFRANKVVRNLALNAPTGFA